MCVRAWWKWWIPPKRIRMICEFLASVWSWSVLWLKQKKKILDENRCDAETNENATCSSEQLNLLRKRTTKRKTPKKHFMLGFNLEQSRAHNWLIINYNIASDLWSNYIGSLWRRDKNIVVRHHTRNRRAKHERSKKKKWMLLRIAHVISPFCILFTMLAMCSRCQLCVVASDAATDRIVHKIISAVKQSFWIYSFVIKFPSVSRYRPVSICTIKIQIDWLVWICRPRPDIWADGGKHATVNEPRLCENSWRLQWLRLDVKK